MSTEKTMSEEREKELREYAEDIGELVTPEEMLEALDAMRAERERADIVIGLVRKILKFMERGRFESFAEEEIAFSAEQFESRLKELE